MPSSHFSVANIKYLARRRRSSHHVPRQQNSQGYIRNTRTQTIGRSPDLLVSCQGSNSVRPTLFAIFHTCKQSRLGLTLDLIAWCGKGHESMANRLMPSTADLHVFKELCILPCALLLSDFGPCNPCGWTRADDAAENQLEYDEAMMMVCMMKAPGGRVHGIDHMGLTVPGRVAGFLQE